MAQLSLLEAPVTDRVLGERDGRQVVQCPACGLIRTLNPPTNYQALYTEGTDYHEGKRGYYAGEANYKERFSHDYCVAKSRWAKFLENWRTLDIGCANGAFVAFAHDIGMQSEGLEINPAMADWATKISYRVVSRSWDEIYGAFDLITYHDVIEHIPDPVAEMRRAYDRLLPGGWLIVDTPDTDDPRFAELGMQWHHMKPVEHLWFFSEATLRPILENAKFTVRRFDRPIPGKLVAYARRLG